MEGQIRFVLDGKIHCPGPVDPNLTVLRYLRENLGRCGSKEGCAEGDCGACTVAVGELIDGQLRYRAVNACIQLLPTLHGKQLVTIENLKDPSGRLHPVQQALVEQHGSQCGFCTPGFAMSMFSLYHQDSQPDRVEINDALAGNLCRCTGYGPIIAATESACQQRREDQFDRDCEQIKGQLEAIRPKHGLALVFSGRRYFAPLTVVQAIDLIDEYPEAVLLAGGTDVGLWVTKQQRSLETILYLGNIAELQRLEQTTRHLEIGAAVSYTDAMPIIGQHFPELGEMMRRIGAAQVRNMGTIGGNIANGSPIGDMPPPLIAAGASVVLDGPQGRREIPLEDYFLDYGKQALRAGELLELIRLPLPRPGELQSCYKISKRFDQDISALCAAFSLIIDDAGKVAEFRAAFGGLAGVPKRATSMEKSLLGQPWTQASVKSAIACLAEDFQPIDDLRASAQYRLQVAGNLLRKFWLENSGKTDKTRLFGKLEHAHGVR